MGAYLDRRAGVLPREAHKGGQMRIFLLFKAFWYWVSNKFVTYKCNRWFSLSLAQRGIIGILEDGKQEMRRIS